MQRPMDCLIIAPRTLLTTAADIITTAKKDPLVLSRFLLLKGNR